MQRVGLLEGLQGLVLLGVVFTHWKGCSGLQGFTGLHRGKRCSGKGCSSTEKGRKGRRREAHAAAHAAAAEEGEGGRAVQGTGGKGWKGCKRCSVGKLEAVGGRGARAGRVRDCIGFCIL